MLISLVSAAGAPGVSTTALAMAFAWSRPTLLIDADPSGATTFQAGYLRGQVTRDKSILDLAIAHRQHRLDEVLFGISIDLPDSTVKLIPGIHTPAQARSLGPVWPDLARHLQDLESKGMDVIVDAGRLGMAEHPNPLIAASDLVLLVTRSHLPGLSAGAAWAGVLREEFTQRGITDRVGVLIVGPDRPYTAREIESAFGLPVVSTMAWDPVNAEVFSLGNPPSRKFDKSLINQSARAASQTISNRITTSRGALDTNTPLGAL